MDRGMTWRKGQKGGWETEGHMADGELLGQGDGNRYGRVGKGARIH